MGNCCKKKQEAMDRNTIVQEDGKITKVCSDKEIRFWKDLNKLGLVKISGIFAKHIEFNYSDLFIENFISFAQIMDLLMIDQNFFYFITVYEMTLAIIDFLQIIFLLKKKYDINYFFYINFNKFYLMKENSKFSKLVYLDSKLNDQFTFPELVVKDDNNFSSFSMLEGGNMQLMLSTLNSTKINNYKTTVAIDVNDMFYSKCNDRYQKLRKNFDLDECENFYAQNVLTFVSKFLFKKTTVSIEANLEHDFNNLKFIMRHAISYFYKQPESSIVNLQNFKELLCNFYLNNIEFLQLIENFNKILHEMSHDVIIQEKIISFQRAEIGIQYGDCDIVNQEKEHKLSFIYDKIIKNASNDRDQLFPPYTICLHCCTDLVMKKCSLERMNYQELEESLLKKNTHIDLNWYTKYICIFFSSAEGQTYLESKKKDIKVHKKNKNKNCITFEITNPDESRGSSYNSSGQAVNKVVNIDFKVRNTITHKKKRENQSILITSKMNNL
jgi:hypothetical protein